VYDFGSGRAFTSRDPLGGVPATPTTTNRYHYADNEPLNKSDPLGLRPCDAGFGSPDDANNLRYGAIERSDPVAGANSLREALGGEKCLLFYDGRNRGLAGVAVGSMSSNHVLIELAATSTTLADCSNVGDLLSRATTIKGNVQNLAVVAYLGYATPEPAKIMFHSVEDSYDRLKDLTRSLKRRGKHVSILAHSWSAQLALRFDSQNADNVDDLIFWSLWDVGTTGAGDYPSNREWYGQNPNDQTIAGLGYVGGTRRFSTANSSGHSDLAGDTLINIRAIATANWEAVRCDGGGDHCVQGLR